MTNYSSNLTAWGSSGSEYPSGYSYMEGEQPVDAWDNFFNSNVYNDLDHLIDLTNSRLDSTRSSAQPTSPTAGQEWYDVDNGELGFYDDVGAAWKTVATQDWVLNEATSSDADTLDGYDSSEFAVRAENEIISGAWDFDSRTTFNDGVDIYATDSHINLFETDNSDKQWSVEVDSNEFRVGETGANDWFRIAPGGTVNMPGGLEVAQSIGITGPSTTLDLGKDVGGPHAINFGDNSTSNGIGAQIRYHTTPNSLFFESGDGTNILSVEVDTTSLNLSPSNFVTLPSRTSDPNTPDDGNVHMWARSDL